MEFTLKNIKTHKGREGEGLNATIYRDGKQVGTIYDDANGGMVDFHFINKGERQKFEDYCSQAWPKTEGAKYWLIEMKGVRELSTQDYMEGFTNTFVDNYHTKKKLDRLAAKKTLFRIEGDDPDGWRTVTAPYSEKVLAFIRDKFGDKLVAIYGQTLEVKQ